MINEDTMVYSEIYEILNQLDKSDLKKIPVKFREVIEQNKDKNYIPQIDISKPLEKQGLKRNTYVLLSILYRDYLCEDEEEKQILQKEFIDNGIKNEEIIKEKYNPEKMFKNKNPFNDICEKNNKLVKYEENNLFKKICTKIINLIKKIKN